MTRSALSPLPRFSTLLLPMAILLFVLAIQAHHFHERPYRQDEAWVIHYALENIERVGLLSHTLQIFHQLLPENFAQDIWVHLFGHTENIARFFSTLFTLAALALFYRLTADLYDHRSAAMALALLGTYSVFSFYTHEARPYAALALGTIGFQWALLRYIRRPSRAYLSLTLLFGVLPFYLHPFILYVFASQMLCALVFLRPRQDLLRRLAPLFITLTLLIAPRAWLNFSNRSGAIEYGIKSNWQGIEELIDHYRFNPEILGWFLLAFATAHTLTQLARPQSSKAGPFRFPQAWPESWLLLSLIIIAAAPLIVNHFVPSLTPRNLLIAAPYLALLLTIALRQLPPQAQLLALLFFAFPFATHFRSHNGNAGYWELAAFVEDHIDPHSDRLAIMAPQAWEWIAINYFLHERADIHFADDDIFYVSWESGDKDSFGPNVIAESRRVTGLAKGDWRRMQPWLDDYETLWIINTIPYIGARNIIEFIENDFTLYQAISFPGDAYYSEIEVLQYRRHPDADQAMWRYGKDFNLLSWSMNSDHLRKPCDNVSVDTWWSLTEPTSKLYSSTLVIADEKGQGIARSDNVPGGIYLTSIWEADRPYFDQRLLNIPCDLPPGQYPLLLGLYEIAENDSQPVQNLEIHNANGQPTGDRLQYLATIIISR